MKLEGKVAVITGGTSGMGLATARRFVAEGATVIITGRHQSALDEAAAAIGGAISGFAGDIASLTDLNRLHEQIRSNHGRVDVLFANAGRGDSGYFGHVTEAEFDAIVGTNLKGTFFTVQTLLPLMPEGASIILNASMTARKGIPGFSVYSATKAGLRSLARSLTAELKDRRIRINTLSPGVIKTPLTLANYSEEAIDAMQAEMTPLGRAGEGEEIAGAALFLASSDSSYVTGIDLCVDGGAAQI
ncbi:oxidoreductase [Sphingobium lactosutens]|uniref:SDR family NAD(P)-dependent oxidoreductase n=1 Tax=Sphingobium lactosutens TaxID=522773 RepID=UPI0015BC7F9A|nr:SDR family oxidoreductase [Sphingobium lactosutens]NWK94430.1 oxidoreductase [Sphingobium lactosutens]